MVQNERLRYLFEKYLDKTSSLQEKDELFQTISKAEHDGDLMQLIRETWNKEFSLHEQDSRKGDIIFQNIIEHGAKTGGKVRKLSFWRYTAAASVLLLVSAGAYFIFNNKATKQIVKTENASKRFNNDLAPGGNKAILTLANGKQIILDNAANGTLTQQGNTKIIKLDSGQLAYQSSSHPEPIEGGMAYNTISTPRGGQYQIVLADGSKVWLNSASSLKFPASFSGKERNVELTGEGYFEIAHNAAMPFHVKVNDMMVEVLGTHFNINAYDDESIIKTTLLEGSVKVTLTSPSPSGREGVRLKPGEQVIATVPSAGTRGQLTINNNVDLDQVIAWQKGLFEFDNTDLGTIMRQISRWYDVDVVYEGKPGDAKFGGGISKNLPLSKVLSLLEANGVKFKVEGRVLKVIP